MRCWSVQTCALFLTLHLAVPDQAHAEILPVPGIGDPHIQTAVYDPLQVVGLRVSPGFAVTILLSPDEKIETVAVGASDRWGVQVNRRGDQLVVKPSASGGAASNMTVTTDQRIYTFSLAEASPMDSSTPYLVSFTYPAPVPDVSTPEISGSGRYKLRGDRALWPEAMTDDGRSTLIRWAADVTQPAVYVRDASGRRMLVNGIMRDGAYAIEGVHDRIEFVLDGRQASAVRQKDGNAP